MAVFSDAKATTVAIVDAIAAPQSQYAARKLGAALADHGYTLQESRARADLTITLTFESKRPGCRILFHRTQGPRDHHCRRRPAGLIYGALALREQLLNGTPLEKTPPARAKPALAFRGIKFNTPWDTYRPSSALDQHYATARDLEFWEAWLDMMVENRFNAFTLWTMHPFTYMIRPANFPEASKWTDAEFAEWQHLYREIFRMAKERGLDTYVVFWSIFVSEEFAKAHNVAKKNFYPHYYVPGDTSEITKRYLRESVTQMLEEYPDLDGIGVSHGEGMAGMTPLERQQFVDEVFIAGRAERKTQTAREAHPSRAILLRTVFRTRASAPTSRRSRVRPWRNSATSSQAPSGWR